MLGLAPLIRPLVEATLEHAGTAWWYEPLAPDRQVWIAHEGKPPDPSGWRQPNSPPSRWERYAQKPSGLQYTTTLYAGRASQLFAYKNRSGDHWPQSWPLQCWLMRMPYDVKVYEVNGPEDWHRLCVAYPEQGSKDDRLVPDWGAVAVAVDWDGVHLSLGGLLSGEQSRYESPEGCRCTGVARGDNLLAAGVGRRVCADVRLPRTRGSSNTPAASRSGRFHRIARPMTVAGSSCSGSTKPGEDPSDILVLLEVGMLREEMLPVQRTSPGKRYSEWWCSRRDPRRWQRMRVQDASDTLTHLLPSRG